MLAAKCTRGTCFEVCFVCSFPQGDSSGIAPHLVRAAVCFQPRCSQKEGQVTQSSPSCMGQPPTHSQRPQIACCTSTTGRPSNYLSMLPCIVLRPYGRVGRQLTADHPPVSERLFPVSLIWSSPSPPVGAAAQRNPRREGIRRSCNVRVCVACFCQRGGKASCAGDLLIIYDGGGVSP